MLLSLPQVLLVAMQCAPAAAPQTIAAIAEVESGFDSLAIGVNGPRSVRIRPTSATQASAIAERLIAQGASVDLGLAQINSKNLASLGVTAADLFDPCRNLAASAEVLSAGFARALAAPRPGEAPLSAALSYYNTGDAERGLTNGYVAKVSAASARIAGLSQPGARQPSLGGAISAPAAWDVFGHSGATLASFVISPAPSGDQP
jgi:type IV secretion system protein VirB1